MPDRPVRSHHLGVKLQLDRLEAFPQLRLCGRVRRTQRREETVSGREQVPHLLAILSAPPTT
jgi:hypothetical protein